MSGLSAHEPARSEPSFLALTWPALAWWAIVLSYAVFLVSNTRAALKIPDIATGAPLAAGYVLSALYAVRAWRRKRWAAVLVNLSVLAMLAAALLGALE